MHGGVGWARPASASVAVVAAAGLLVSGGTGADPRTPAGLPGLPPPYLGTALVGEGGLTAAIDAYGDVVDLRAPGPAGKALIDDPSDRQAAGTVPKGTGIVPWVSLGGRPPRPLWSADAVRQRYRPGTNLLVTAARFGSARVRIVYAAGGSRLGCLTAAGTGVRIRLRTREPAAAERLRCDDRAARSLIRAGARSDRSWLRAARPLGAGAPRWAVAMYGRSLLVLRALTGRRSGAVAAGPRDGWAYVWPRDAAAVALALEAAGYRAEARRVVRFLVGLELGAAARFYEDGEPAPGRGQQGDASGWVAAAARAVGLPAPQSLPWRNRPDYQEGEPGDYLGNALAAAGPAASRDGARTGPYKWTSSRGPRGLVRRLGDPGSGLDSAAAWGVRPFPQPRLYHLVGETLRRLSARGTRFGITPGEAWPGKDPWSAPTAWSAWSLAALGDRRDALCLLADLRRAATPPGLLPERVDARTGVPRSTTPLAWSHAFLVLALQELWPGRAAPNFHPGR